MDQNTSKRGNSLRLALAGIALVLAGGVMGWYGQERRIETVVHDYILEHPEILPKAMENLEKRENARRLAGAREGVETPFPGAVLGNPQGKVTLVEFSDFACTFCRQSVAEVEELVAANPDLRVVVRELPILSPASADAARWGLAAAEQGKYPAFHRAMFEAGRPGPETIQAAAQAAGLDFARARRTIAEPRVDAEIRNNLAMAQQLGFNGTPSWVVGDEILSGAVGKAALAEAIGKARD